MSRGYEEFLSICFVACSALMLSGCNDPMYRQPKYTPLDKSALFRDGMSARPLPEGVVERHLTPGPPGFETGMVGGQFVASNPLPITVEVLRRGRQRYDIFCSPCHGLLGDGQGMIVQRGFGPPPTFHSERLRGLPEGHYFAVQTRGFGRMGSYAAQVPTEDRWAIAAYIRVLQLSRGVKAAELSADQRRALEEGGHGGG